ncbi:QsdR family transcriptional regulator [Amycolatopsis cynarae]|uniref:QsdR family transcriptional regulator n=1 Tax=Amycolatopsis cynarae TaxID=2995223 RepID=A0ABY7B8P8_9PSEU|nr:QsdR family transcriptional regulator [Amycolatopsis sp. HUAS 11-8]WAL68730.1 QsdR family transcriptional regulator [Amycolatopsis sp. HUAS 11-8]
MADVEGGATKLARELGGTDSTEKPGPLTAFALARRLVLTGQRVDMKNLAAELGVDRATLFRWVGNRDQLLVEILWSTAEPTWRHAVHRADGTNAARVVAAIDGFVRDVINAEFFVVLLRREPERTLRLLTTKAGEFQRRLCARIARLLTDEQETNGLTLPLPVRDMAYLLVRIAESFIYSDLIIGETPDAARAKAAVGVLLGVPQPGSS